MYGKAPDYFFGFVEGSYYQQSYEAANGKIDKLSKLDKDLTAEVCIVGGGYTGLSTALHLAEKGVNVVLLEADVCGLAASGRNGGQLHIGQRQDQHKIEKSHGFEHARELWDISQFALSYFHQLRNNYNIECDWQEGLVQAAHKKRHYEELVDYANKLKSDYGYSDLEVLNSDELSREIGTKAYIGGVLDKLGGHLHPLKFARGLFKAALDKKVMIYEESPVIKIEEGLLNRVHTSSGIVSCKYVVISTAAMTPGLYMNLDKAVHPLDNYIAVTEPIDNITDFFPNRVCVADTRNVVRYWRPTKDSRILFGGGETTTSMIPPSQISKFVRPYFEDVYPDLKGIKFDFSWGGRLSLTVTRMPLIKEFENRIIVAAGFSGQGVCLSPFVGKIIAANILGENKLFDIYQRVSIPNFPGGKLLRQFLFDAAIKLYAIMDRF